MYRRRPTIKFKANGRQQRYVNLAVFNSECSKRGVRGNICTLVNIRCLKDGGGLATVRSESGVIRGRGAGVWRLHFNDCGIMKRHLRGRVEPVRPGMLDGKKR